MYLNKIKIISLLFIFLILNSAIPASAVTEEEINDYSIKVSQFITQKCHGSCSEIIIVGDDYVVPRYRSEFPLDPALIQSSYDEKIFTDSIYIQKSKIQFRNFKNLFTNNGEYQGKDILFIVPSYFKEEINNETSRLKKELTDNGYGSDIKERDDSDISCKNPMFFNEFAGKTLFIFGKDNNALRCMPNVLGYEDSATIEINPWDGKNYAVIINSDAKVHLQTFRNIIMNESAVELFSEWMYFAELSIEGASYASIFFGADTFIDGLDSTFQCGIKKDSIGCGVGIAAMALPFVVSGPVRRMFKGIIDQFDGPIKKIILSDGDGFLKKLINIFKRGDEVNFEKHLKKFDEFFPEEVIESTVKNVDDVYSVRKGTQIALRKVDDLDDFAKHLGRNSVKKADFLKNIGKIDEINPKIAEDIIELSDIEGVEKLTKNIVDNKGAKGFLFEAETATVLKKNGEDIAELSRKIDYNLLGDGEIDVLFKNGNIGEMKYDWLANTPNKNNPKIKGFMEDIEKKYQRFKYFQVQEGNIGASVIIYSNVEPNPLMKEYIENIGYKIEVLI